MTLTHPSSRAASWRYWEVVVLADLLVADPERRLPWIERQPEPVHDASTGTAFAH